MAGILLKQAMPKATLVLTTICDPVILEDYRRNFDRYGHLDSVEVIVIPDLKTPPAVFDTCRRMARLGLEVICPSVETQDSFLTRVGLDPRIIPRNSDNRRNIGFLMSVERDPDFLISIDDDNYCDDGADYFSAHADVLCGRRQHTIAASATRFLNICDLLDISTPPVYARGFPYFARHREDTIVTRVGEPDVMINAGLWLNDPDVDAITWLGLRPRVRGFKNRSLALNDCTWSPVNSQNTALRSALIPAYYFIRMGYPIGGAAVDRYGDIFSGYFALACAKHLGGTARFGTPLADHRRNSHNYVKDATAEWPAILLLEDLLGWLIDARLSGPNCLEAYLSLSYGIEEVAERFQGQIWNDAARAFFHQMAYLMRAWLNACRTLGANGTVSRTLRSAHENLGSDVSLLGDRAAAGIREANPQPARAMAIRGTDRGSSQIEPAVPVAL